MEREVQRSVDGFLGDPGARRRRRRPAGFWRTEAGDVALGGRPAFDAHMDAVGEEDQSVDDGDWA